MEDIKFEVIKKITDTRFKYKNFGNISKLDSNSPPSVFIGSKLRYPLVNVGILSPLERDEDALRKPFLKADTVLLDEDLTKLGSF